MSCYKCHKESLMYGTLCQDCEGKYHALEGDIVRLKARLRETAQILIDEIGASGPKTAEDSAREAVEIIIRLRDKKAVSEPDDNQLFTRKMIESAVCKLPCTAPIEIARLNKSNAKLMAIIKLISMEDSKVES